MPKLATQPLERIKDGSPEAKQTVFKALFRIRDLWELSDPKLAELLHVDKSTVSLWRKKGQVPDSGERVEVIKTVLALHRSLGSMFRAPADQIAWLTTSHPAFGAPPLDVATKSLEGLFRVRRYVDYVRGRGA